MKNILKYFKKETWYVLKEESVKVWVDFYDSGYPLHVIEATLIFEESSKGKKRYWMREHTGVFSNKPYLFNFDTKKPLLLKGEMVFKTKI